MSSKANECSGLEDVKYIRALGGERLHATTCALHPNQKTVYILSSERDRVLLLSVCYTQRPNVSLSCAWPAPTTPHRPSCEHCDPRVSRSPNERVPFRFQDTIVDFVERCRWRTRNLAVFRVKHTADLFSGRSCPELRRIVSIFGFFQSPDLFFMKSRAQSERYINITAGIRHHSERYLILQRVSLKVKLFPATSRFQ